jgi:hypothetical protein
VFRPRPAYRFRSVERRDLAPTGASAGRNPPYGASLSYWLRDEPKDDVTIEILDARGFVVRRLTSAKAEPETADRDPDFQKEEPKPLPRGRGVRRAAWDLRLDGAPTIRRAKLDAGDPAEGPLALPGTYTVRLTVDGRSQTAPLEVRSDPRSTAATGDREAQLALALQLRDDLARLARAVEDLRGVREQLLARSRLLEGRPAAAPLVEAARALAGRCDAIEAGLHNPKAEVAYDILAMPGGAKLYSRLAPLYTSVTEGEGAPTGAMRELAARLRGELDARLAEWKAIVETDVPALDARARELAPEFVVLPAR